MRLVIQARHDESFAPLRARRRPRAGRVVDGRLRELRRGGHDRRRRHRRTETHTPTRSAAHAAPLAGARDDVLHPPPLSVSPSFATAASPPSSAPASPVDVVPESLLVPPSLTVVPLSLPASVFGGPESV